MNVKFSKRKIYSGAVCRQVLICRISEKSGAGARYHGSRSGAKGGGVMRCRSGACMLFRFVEGCGADMDCE